MVLPEKQIKKNNLDFQIVELEKQVEIKRLELHEIAERENKLKEDIESHELEKKKFAERVVDQVKIDNAIRNTTIEKSNAGEEKEKVMKDNLTSLQTQIRHATKELTRLNISCLNATNELESLNKQKTELDNKVLELTKLVLHFEEMQVKVKNLGNEQNIIEIDITNKRDSWNIDLENAKKELEKINKEVIEKIEERNKAEYATKVYTDNLYTSMNDWHIIRNRLETRWNEHYPELELPIAE